MKRPYQCFGIVAEAQPKVNGIDAQTWDVDSIPDITEQAPAAAFLGTLGPEYDYQSWRTVGEATKWLCAMPKDRAKEVLSIFERAIDRSSSTGSRP